jgi:ubiquinone/menaquinone biosynthesis C-methylase UbiE
LAHVDAISQAYLDFAERTKGTLLEIAAGYGHMVTKALEADAGKVFANEIDARQLAILKARAPAEYADKLVCCLGEFPERVDFPEASFDGVYTARLFHFFDGERIRVSLSKVHGWLKPGGKVFLVSDAIYRTIFKAWIPTYERRVATGDAWQGVIQDIRSCVPENLHPEDFPDTMNFLDATVLDRELRRAGFKVEIAGLFPYTGKFALARLDGREIAGAVGLKE